MQPCSECEERGKRYENKSKSTGVFKYVYVCLSCELLWSFLLDVTNIDHNSEHSVCMRVTVPLSLLMLKNYLD